MGRDKVKADKGICRFYKLSRYHTFTQWYYTRPNTKLYHETAPKNTENYIVINNQRWSSSKFSSKQANDTNWQTNQLFQKFVLSLYIWIIGYILSYVNATNTNYCPVWTMSFDSYVILNRLLQNHSFFIKYHATLTLIDHTKTNSEWHTKHNANLEERYWFMVTELYLRSH